ncbi:MAG: twin-arginine translocase subunit TatB [Pelagibacterales bacterium]|nr:twin-arginine translocase subunit TatB [Pelagibacterales bacterium]
MPQIGWFEILLIVAVAIVVIGPKDFPFVLKKIGSWIGTIKKYIASFQDQVSSLTNESIDTDLEETKPVKTETSKKEKNNEQK